MIRELHDLSREDQDAWARKTGGFNDFPPNWREISEEVFAKSAHFTWTFVMTEHRQMLTPKRDVPCVSATLLWQQDSTGYALVNDFWGGKVRYYTFGCEHVAGDAAAEMKKRGLRLENMQHATYCPKCNFLAIYDTSD